jgi:hypothetical protein
MVSSEGNGISHGIVEVVVVTTVVVLVVNATFGLNKHVKQLCGILSLQSHSMSMPM